MINNLYQIARERQSEMRNEVKTMHNLQKVKTNRITQARRMLSAIPVLVVFITVLAKFLGS